MALKRRGQTMIELVIYIVMAGLAAVTIMGLYSLAQRTQSASFSSSLLNGQTELSLARLRRELQETALPSIVAYPNTPNKAEPPGLAFPSAYRDQMEVSAYSQPNWDRHVYYTLVPVAGKETGKVVRWEQPFAAKDFLPQLPLLKPSVQAVPPSTAFLNVLMPNQPVEGLKDQPNYKADGFGGFRVQFVRRAGGDQGAPSLSSDNPITNKDIPADNTKLLELELKILSRSNMGKANFYTIRFRVHPRFPN